MTKKDRLIQLIDNFFANSAKGRYELGKDEVADTFMLEDALMVKAINSTGVEVMGHDVEYQKLTQEDLQHIVDWVIDSIEVDERKTMDKTRN